MGSWPRYALLALLLTAVFVHVRAADDSEAGTRRAELDRARFAQQMDEASLQVLQAQIEPHFLFNTLANVRRLCARDLAAGDAMLRNLMGLPRGRAAADARDGLDARAGGGVSAVDPDQTLPMSMRVPAARSETLIGAGELLVAHLNLADDVEIRAMGLDYEEFAHDCWLKDNVGDVEIVGNHY